MKEKRKNKIIKRRSQSPLVSVLMPVYNTEKYVGAAIASIKAQTVKNWELLCVDDGSTDKTPTILRSFSKRDKRIKIITNGHRKGIGHSLNKALLIAKGEYIARMDADDISLPYRFEKQIELLKHNLKIVACGGQAAMIDTEGNIFAYKTFPTDPDSLYKMIMKVVPIQHPILMARANVMKRYRYLEKVSTAEDVDLLFYLLRYGKFSNVNSVIYHYRKTDLSNGYHNVKKTFYTTFKIRFSAMQKYGYTPHTSGVLISILEFIVVSLLPAKLVIKLFEIMRFEPPFWSRSIFKFIQPTSDQFIFYKNK